MMLPPTPTTLSCLILRLLQLLSDLKSTILCYLPKVFLKLESYYQKRCQKILGLTIITDTNVLYLQDSIPKKNLFNFVDSI